MTNGLDDVLVERVDSLGATEWTGECFRYAASKRDPLSGEGARRNGGRWNPPDLFPAIYLADSELACMVEVDRAARAQHLPPEDMLSVPYRLHTIEVADLSVLDLRTTGAQESVGLEIDDVFGDDWSACQAVGQAAWFLDMAGVLAPSAGGIGLVITAYELRARPGQITVKGSTDLTPSVYRDLRQRRIPPAVETGTD